MKYIHLGVCICIFLFVHNQILRADETVSDDSLYTAEYINSIYIAQPKRALQLLDEAENRKAIPGYNNFLSFINATSDALLYTQSFCNLAEDKGLGTCYLGTTVYMPQMIIDVLKLPKLVFPIATITLGWPNEEPNASDRLPLNAIMHNEHYEDYTPDKIDNYYNVKENLEENIHFVEINKKETLAQIFTDIRYTKKDNEGMSKGMIDALKNQGFL